jgi:hypothetical protein
MQFLLLFISHTFCKILSEYKMPLIQPSYVQNAFLLNVFEEF